MHLSFTSFLYRILIDPVLSQLHQTILAEIKPSDKVIDVACGTGSLSLAIAKRARSVMGIDLSEEMLGSARRSANKRSVCNAGFIVLDASEMKIFRDKEFNIAVTSMAVHQFDAEVALKVLSEMKRIATGIVIVDYNYPLPGRFYKWLVNTIESIAGGDHYRNFKLYMKNGGISHFINLSGLVVKSQTVKGNGIFLINVCERPAK